jgi:hypothetical protein
MNSISRGALDRIMLLLAAGIGTAIGYVDSRPTWDDTGITVGVIVLTAATLAAVRPRSAWLVGFCVGLPVVLFNLAAHGGVASVAALAIGLVGAGLGRIVGSALDGNSTDSR